jgi:hypothetical protein
VVVCSAGLDNLRRQALVVELLAVAYSAPPLRLPPVSLLHLLEEQLALVFPREDLEVLALL